MIKTDKLTKKYRERLAVDKLSFQVSPGRVTGFLGPNGAGKSTTMRLMLGLDKGQGSTLYDNKPLSSYARPSQVVGVLLEAKAFHPTRSAKNHLKVLAAAADVPDSRVNEVLKIVGLSEVAKKAPGKFSLGMSQRLGIAAAILGEPKYLILDEPANGLDPEGIAWLRRFIRDYAKAGNGVLISSHLLGEVSQMADDVVVIGKGKLIVDTSVSKLLSGSASTVFVRVKNTKVMKTALEKAGFKFEQENGGLMIAGAGTDEVGQLAYAAKTPVMELYRHTASLEEAFLELTGEAQEFKAEDKRKASK